MALKLGFQILYQVIYGCQHVTIIKFIIDVQARYINLWSDLSEYYCYTRIILSCNIL